MNFNPEGKEHQLMTDSAVIYRYIHGGKGEVTLVSPRTYKAHTYKFLKPADEYEFPDDTIFVYVLHQGRRMYLGMLTGKEFRRTAKSSFGEETEAMKGARFIVKMSFNQELVDTKGMLLYHSGRCCYCNRMLRSPKASEQGIGKKCLKYYNARLGKKPWDGN